MSNTWLTEYTSALTARDQREKAQESYTNAYTHLADRTAKLEAERNNLVPASTSSPQPAATKTPASPSPSSRSRFGRSSPATTAAATEPLESPNDMLSRLRADLAATQRSRAQLQAQLTALNAELSTVRTESSMQNKQMSELVREKAVLERKVRDRDSEIKGKGRLVEEVQDELVSLNLQLNMSEQRAEKLDKENKELVERWMKRMKEEAEKMNKGSGWE